MDTVEHVEDSSLNIQNDFFNNARKNHTRITVFLTNGQRISGLIRSFDKFTVILETRNGDQMVFKHAVTTVAMARPGDEDFRGPRPARPAGDRAGEHRPGGGRPPRFGPGGPPQGRPGGPPGADPSRHSGPRPEGESRPRGGSGPQGKSFGNFLDLSSLNKDKAEGATTEAAAPSGAASTPAPTAHPPAVAKAEPQVAPAAEAPTDAS